jgi:hypothetical protein
MLKYAAHRFQGEGSSAPDLAYIQRVIRMLEPRRKGL